MPGDGDFPVLLHPEDRLVVSSELDLHLNACLGRQLCEANAQETYARGFKLSARKLVLAMMDGETLDLPVDTIVYPVFYLYRHHFELLLKLLIAFSRKLLHEPLSAVHGHDLNRLWEQASPMVVRCLDDIDLSQNSVVTALFEELESYDSNSEAARYPFDRKGNKHFANLASLHLRHFAEVAERLSTYLETLIGVITSRYQYELEYESEM